MITKGDSAFRGKTAAITGASGYLGSSLADTLGRAGASLLRVPRQMLRDADAWAMTVERADFVFHLAAQTSVYAAAKDPRADFTANVEPMLRLLEACAATERRPLIVFAGSATECGLPAHDRLPDAPVTIYDTHKLLSEIALESYCRMGLARGTTLRLCNVYGPGPRSSSSDRGVINTMTLRGLRGEAITLYDKGSQLRDYLFIDDAVSAFMAAAAAAERVNGRHFVLGTGQGRTIADAFAAVANGVAQAGLGKPQIREVPSPDGLSPIEGRSFVADPSAFIEATGWKPETPFDVGVARTVTFFRSRLAEAI